MDDLFTIKYSDEIVDLFLKFKDISNNYGSTLFNKKCNSYDLVEFLQDNTYLIEKDNISKENELFMDDNY
jgi:hypothetical protein